MRNGRTNGRRGLKRLQGDVTVENSRKLKKSFKGVFPKYAIITKYYIQKNNIYDSGNNISRNSIIGKGNRRFTALFYLTNNDIPLQKKKNKYEKRTIRVQTTPQLHSITALCIIIEMSVS